MADSLWGDEFVVPNEKETAKKIVNKVSKPKEVKVSVEKQIKSKKISLDEKLALITENVLKTLGKQKENVEVIKTKERFSDYIDKAINVGRIDIDTETNNSLDPITCKIMGLCLYVPGEKQTYIPVNHRNKDTGERLDWQLTETDIKEELQKLLNAKTYIVMHNGKFDYEVIKCTCGIEIPPNWDTMIGAKLLDENEKSAGLKQQYIQKIDPEQEKYDIEHLFKGVEYADVDPDIFALYAATDALMTDKLYEWQMDKFKDPDLAKVLKLANDVEMPTVQVLAEMEMAGMEVDMQYAELLSKKFHKRLDAVDENINVELEKLAPQIAAWRLTPEANFKPKKKTGDGDGKSKAEQLTDPINLASPVQLAILFYDILKAPQVDKKQPRATGEEALKAIAEKLHLNICDYLLERRELVKLLTTYIDTIPELAKRWPDGRVRTHFNQYGAATGRLSSSDPINFQNIPSHELTIRMEFKAKEKYRIIGGDYSAQEPRLTAFMSQDPAMIKAYQEGKDLYSVIASMSFGRKYEDCLEFYPEGTVIDFEGKKVVCGHKTHQNKEGKQYRSMAKSILLGIEYGRGAASVGEQIGKSREEAQKIIDQFFKSFPKVKQFINDSIASAHEKGYVEDVAGRRRRLPDAQLPKYDIKYKDPTQAAGAFNPFLGCENKVDESSDKLLIKYIKKCENIKYAKEYERIQQDALKEGIEIHSNTGFIAQAERQAVNSRIQGGAATLTKCALLSIFRDTRLKDIGAYLINSVHDEILMEVPEEHSKLAEKLLVENMVNSAKAWVHNVPMSCDTYNVNCWYIENYTVLVEGEFKKLLDKGLSAAEAFEKECESRSESTRSQIYEIVKEVLGDYIPPDVDISYKSFTALE